MTRPPSIIVIGGGIVGIACAHYLNEAGFIVTLVEKGQVGGACSAANLGMICPSHILPLAQPGTVTEGLMSLLKPQAAFRIKPSIRRGFISWMLQFARRCNRRDMLDAGQRLQPLLTASMQAYEALIGEGLDAQWQTTGLLYVFKQARSLADFATADQLIDANFGLQAQRLNSAQLHEFEPALRPDLAGGFFYPQDRSLRPDVVLNNWQQLLQERGVTIKEHCEVLSFSRSTAGISKVITNQGALAADQYLLATGAWSAKLANQLNLRLPIEPGKGYSLTLPRPEKSPGMPILLPEQHLGITPFKDDLRLGSMMEFTGFDSSISLSRIQQLRVASQAYLQSDLTTSEGESWYGWRPMTPDSLPIIDRAPQLNNLILATGHNMLGMTLAPATGQQATEIALGRVTTKQDNPFRLARFRAGSQF